MFKGFMFVFIMLFKNGELDLDMFKKLVEWYISEGFYGLVFVGIMGESLILIYEEYEIVIEEVVKVVVGCIFVIVGVGFNNIVEVVCFM